MKFDVVVVGAGTAGCLAAKTAAEAGLKVCVVDRKSREQIGAKVCGDAMGEHHFKNVGLEKPNGSELEQRIGGVQIFSPDMNTVFTIEDKDFVGYLLNRRLFGQWLLGLALNAGATLMDSTMCLKPKISKDFVAGVSAKDLKSSKTVDLESKVVLDASGFMGVIRQKLPEHMMIEREIAKEDVEACYREIRQLKQETDQSKYCEIYLNNNVSPGGYVWVFPKSSTRVNAGLGVCMRGKFPNPKDRFCKSVLTRSTFEGSLLLEGGVWWDPTRRPLDNLVGNGVAVLGDAAALVNPIHGGGIGPSMLSGYLAGKTVTEALDMGDVSQKSLWPLNRWYMDMYGTKQAALDVFRLFLIFSSDKDLNYGMSNHLMTEADVLRASLGDDFRLNITEKTRRVYRGLRRLRFLNKLRLTVNVMNQVRAHYKDYPENPEDFPQWKTKTEGLFKAAKARLSR